MTALHVLAGLRYCYEWWGEPGAYPDFDPLFEPFSRGLLRTAALYGVTP